MFRKSILMIAAAGLCLAAGLHTDARADNDALRNYELRLVNLNRGYLRPMTDTLERMRKLTEFSRLEPIGHIDGVTKFKLTTVLSEKQIAEALGLTLLSSTNGNLVMTPGDEGEAARAEARAVMLTIIEALQAKFGKDDNGDKVDKGDKGEPSTDARPKDMADLLKRLELPESLIEGKFYKAADYHLTMSGNATYILWAGSSFQGLKLANVNDWELNDKTTIDPDPASNFVGVRVGLEQYNKGVFWIDLHGSDLNDYGFERDQRLSQRGTSRGELAVIAGGRRIKTILLAMANYRQKEAAKKPVAELPSGRMSDYELKQNLKVERDDYSLYETFPDDAISLSWSQDSVTGHAIARCRSHFMRHPMHLDATLDADAEIPAIKPEDKDLTAVAVTWAVAPETGPEDFRKRREESDAAMALIRDALFAAAKAGESKLTGSLSDKQFVTRLKLDSAKLDGKYFRAADYAVSRQMLNDVAITVGSPTSGGCRWMLVDLKAQTTIRSGQ